MGTTVDWDHCRGHFMHREHAPRLQLEYRIREVEGEKEKEKEGDKQNKRVSGAGWWGLPVPEAVHRNSRRLCSLSPSSAFLPRPSSAF